jgi:hypothetical protein
MIKHIINIIKSWFTSKEEMDPHEVMLHPEKPDTPIYKNEQAVKAEHCPSHLRFRKNCKACQEVVA